MKTSIIRFCYILSGILLILFNSLTDYSKLPDYYPYQIFFDLEFHKTSFNAYSVIIAIFNLLKSLGLDYDSSRLIISGLSSFLFLANLNSSKIQNHFNSRIHPILIPIIVFYILIFCIEFFHIRLRAGVSIIFFSLGLRQGSRIIKIIFFLLSLLTHPETGIINLFLFAPIYSTILDWRYARSGLILLMSLLILILFYYLSVFIQLIRPDFTSPLNPFRFYISYFLIILFLAQKFILGKIDFILKQLKGNEFNIALFIALNFAYFLGLTTESGEAIVRLATLSSFLSLFMIATRFSKMSLYFNLYIGVVNSLFFLNTLKWI